MNRLTAEPFYYNCENLQAIRRGPWKLHLPRSKEQLPFWDNNKAFANLPQPVLYNLQTDQAEKTNVAAENPKIVKQMMGLAGCSREPAEQRNGSGTVPSIAHEQRNGASIDHDTSIRKFRVPVVESTLYFKAKGHFRRLGARFAQQITALGHFGC